MHSVTSILRRSASLVLASALLYGCASSQAGQEVQAPQAAAIAGMVGRQLLVLPTQYLAVANAGGGWDIVPSGQSLLPILDEELEDVFRKRGVKGNWTFGRQITQAALRNGGLAGDPRDLHASAVRRIKAGDTPLPEPMASDVRSLVGLTSARYALIPLEVHVDTRDNVRSGSVRFLLVDARTARVTWADDVVATPVRDPQMVADALTPFGFRTFARDLATKFADMVVGQ